MKRAAMLFALIAAIPLHAGTVDVSDLERVLIPVYRLNPLPGVGNTLWHADATVYNSSERPFWFYPEILPNSRVRGAIQAKTLWGLDLEWDLNPFMVSGDDDIAGRLVFVDRAAGDAVTFHATIDETAGSIALHGVEIPVIREREFHSGTISLAPIELTSSTREMLRVYDPYQTENASVLVSFWQPFGASNAGAAAESSPHATLITSKSLTLRVKKPIDDERYVTEPAYGEMPFNATLLAIPSNELPRSIAIEIEPLTPGLHFWAFVSETDNVTQQVRTITPH